MYEPPGIVSRELYPVYSFNGFSIENAGGEHFANHVSGWEEHIRIENNTGCELLVYDRWGNFLRTLPSVRPDRISSYGYEVKVTVKTRQQSTKDRYTPPEINVYKTLILPVTDINSNPIIIKEIGLILATSVSQSRIRPIADLFLGVTKRRQEIYIGKDSTDVPPMTVFANVDPESASVVWISMNNTIIPFPIVRTELMEPGKMIVRLPEVHATNPGCPDKYVGQEFLIDDLLHSPNGVITLNNNTQGSVIYSLGLSYDVVNSYLHGCAEKEMIAEREEKGSVVSLAEVETIVRNRTVALRDDLDRTVAENEALQKNLTESIQQCKVQDRRNADLLKNLNEARDPETVEEIVARKEEEKDHVLKEKALHRRKTTMEMVKQGIGIVTAFVGAVTLLVSPFKFLAGWFSKPSLAAAAAL